MLDRFRATYFYICWLPLGLYILSDVYISTSTGWGQWAIGVVALPPMLLSAAFLLAGLFIISEAIQAGAPVVKVGFATFIAGSVFLWFVGRTLIQVLAG